jgi:hypothetical protein
MNQIIMRLQAVYTSVSIVSWLEDMNEVLARRRERLMT